METIKLRNENNNTKIEFTILDNFVTHPFVVTLDDETTAKIRALGDPEDGYPGSDEYCLKDGLTNIELWKIG